ncbi:hypothetical protein D9M68_944180 [compost metagenome]
MLQRTHGQRLAQYGTEVYQAEYPYNIPVHRQYLLSGILIQVPGSKQCQEDKAGEHFIKHKQPGLVLAGQRFIEYGKDRADHRCQYT